MWELNYDIRTLFNTFLNVDTQDDGGEEVQATLGSQVLVLGKVYVASGNIQRFGVPFFPRGTASKVQWVVLGFGLFFFKIKRSHKPFLFLLSQILECVDVSSFLHLVKFLVFLYFVIDFLSLQISLLFIIMSFFFLPPSSFPSFLSFPLFFSSLLCHHLHLFFPPSSFSINVHLHQLSTPLAMLHQIFPPLDLHLIICITHNLTSITSHHTHQIVAPYLCLLLIDVIVTKKIGSITTIVPKIITKWTNNYSVIFIEWICMIFPNTSTSPPLPLIQLCMNYLTSYFNQITLWINSLRTHSHEPTGLMMAFPAHDGTHCQQ